MSTFLVYFADHSLSTCAMTAVTPPDTGRFRQLLENGFDDDCPRFIAAAQIKGGLVQSVVFYGSIICAKLRERVFFGAVLFWTG